jgi:hypothetical protein
MRRFGFRAAVLVALLATAPSLRAQDAWGDIKGRVVWGPKEIPVREPIAKVKEHADRNHCLKDGDVLDEQWVVNPKNRGLRWTIVWLINVDPKNLAPLPVHPSLQAVPKNDVEIDQPVCAFIPHAVAMRAGQKLLAKNSSPVLHNVKATSRNNNFNVAIAPGGSKDFTMRADALPVKIECSIHGWMFGFIGVFDHPYFAVTDADGNFTIKSAPAGQYRLLVYNDRWLNGSRLKCPVIDIPAGKTLDLGNLAFTPPPP